MYWVMYYSIVQYSIVQYSMWLIYVEMAKCSGLCSIVQYSIVCRLYMQKWLDALGYVVQYSMWLIQYSMWLIYIEMARCTGYVVQYVYVVVQYVGYIYRNGQMYWLGRWAQVQYRVLYIQMWYMQYSINSLGIVQIGQGQGYIR